MADKTDIRKINALGTGANEEIEISYDLQDDGTYAERKSLAATENTIGKVGGNGANVDASVAMTTAGAYDANDFVGVDATPVTFSNCARINGGSGWLLGAVLTDKALQSAELELWLFDDEITPPSDNAAWSLSDADMQKFLGVIEFKTYFASALNSGSNPENTKAVRFTCQSDSKNLYGAIVTRGTPTYATDDLFVRLMILQD